MKCKPTSVFSFDVSSSSSSFFSGSGSTVIIESSFKSVNIEEQYALIDSLVSLKLKLITLINYLF